MRNWSDFGLNQVAKVWVDEVRAFAWWSNLMSFEKLGKGIVKRTNRRVVGLFIDGTGLDRATRRINRKVDLHGLVRGVTQGLPLIVARYYTLIPYEDDSRQHSFLDAVARAGLSVIVKRLPPKGINRQASVDVEMASDMVAFASGVTQLTSHAEYLLSHEAESIEASKNGARIGIVAPNRTRKGGSDAPPSAERAITSDATSPHDDAERIVTVVCPSRDLSYPIAMAKHLGVDTVTADFAQFNAGDILKSAAKWIDLSDSETIWRE